MNNEEKIYTLLEEIYIELQGTKKELKEDINNVRSELKEDIDNVRSELKGDIKRIETEMSERFTEVYENQKVFNEKLDETRSDIKDMKESIAQIEMVTASNWRDIVKIKSII